MTPLIDLSRRRCDKLFAINVADFGIPGGKTCPWKTETCFCFCYGRGGRWVASSKPYERLRRIEEMPARAFYLSISGAYLDNHLPLRIGRVGDATNIEQVRAIIEAILENNIPFMWTTRAWGAPHSQTWQLFEKYLPGQIICSIDQDVDRAQVPSGWPIADIALPPIFDIDPDVCWCPHYPIPGLIKPVYNCIECMLCYARPSDERRRPHIAFMLHTRGAPEVERRHYPEGYWLKHLHTLCKRRPHHAETEIGHDAQRCGILTPDGWLAPDDNA